MCELNPFRPTGLYDTMLMRVCPYTLRGFLYYQGESDDHKPDSYYELFTALIKLWRTNWGDDDLPFILTQLPMFRYAHDPDYKHWAKIRSAQMRAYRTVKNTGMAVILDCGELDNIHPTDKKPVGERLCLQAEKLVCYKLFLAYRLIFIIVGVGSVICIGTFLTKCERAYGFHSGNIAFHIQFHLHAE